MNDSKNKNEKNNEKVKKGDDVQFSKEVESKNTKEEILEKKIKILETLLAENSNEFEKFNKEKEKIEQKSKLYETMARELKVDVERIKERNANIKTESKENSVVEIVSKFLPIMDNFTISIKACGNGDFKTGFEMIYKQMQKFLTELGVEEIKCEGEVFNPEFHEAIMKQPNSNKELSGKIVNVVAKGYALSNGRVIRHSVVTVFE